MKSPPAVVLGRPGSGCTTLLKTLANQTSEYHSLSGTVRYDALTPSDIAQHHRGDVQYVPEDDVHFPTLSVQHTVAFAAKARAPQGVADSYVDALTNMYAAVFGLKGVLATPVGDAAIRGVSGGEKKRVSISEALAARGLITAWDK